MQYGADMPAAHHQPWSGPLGPGQWSTWGSCPQKSPDKQKRLFGSCPSLPSFSDHRTESGFNSTQLWKRSISLALAGIETLRKALLIMPVGPEELISVPLTTPNFMLNSSILSLIAML